MARRVFLHIGTMKSATTYIQALCHVNDHRLAAQGMLCPSPGMNFAAINVLLGSSYIRPWNEDAWTTLADQIRNHDGDVFLSNEILSLRSRRKSAELVAALAPAEVHVMVTARDLARVIPSQWQEGTANRQTSTWTEYAASVCADQPPNSDIADRFWRRQDIPAFLSRWLQSVPKERTTLVTVPQGNDPGVLAARCGTALALNFSDFEEPVASHSSLGAHSAELMRRLNTQLDEIDVLDYRTGFHKGLCRAVLAPRASHEPRIALSAREHAWAFQRAQRMITELESLGIAVVGDLADLLPAPYKEGSGIDPGTASDSDLLATSLDGLAGVTKELASVQIAYDDLRRRKRADSKRN
jgi:hypothetical protein